MMLLAWKHVLAKNLSARRLLRARVLGLLLGLALGACWANGQAQPGADPVPIRRIMVAPDRLAAELMKTKQGTLVPLSREELEKQLAQAAKAQEAAKAPPRLVQATYAAEYQHGHLTLGTGTWTVHYDGPGPALLPLTGLNLALSKVKYAGGGDAVIGDLNGKTLSMWLDKAGPHSIFLDWSARGVAKAEGVTFALNLPPCPRTTLELKLPADHVLTVSNPAILVSGPHVAENPNLRIWRLQTAGSQRLEVVIRPAPAADPARAAVLGHLQAVWKLQPGNLAVDFELQIDVLQAPLKELTLACPASLEPFDVTIRGADLDSWNHAPSKDGKGMGILVVQFRQPFQGHLPSLKIRCLGPLTRNALWTVPALHLRNAVLRSEQVTLQLHPDLQWQRWNPGSFRERPAAALRESGQTITLINDRPQSSGQGRPTGWLAAGAPHLTARLQTWWRLHPRNPLLGCDLTYTLSQGQLFQLAVKIPNDWSVEAVTAEPKDLLASWSAAESILRLELARSLKPGLASKFKVQMRPSGKAAQTDLLDIPELDPLDATVKEGLITVTADAHAKVLVVKANGPVAEPAKAGPWSGTAPLFALPWRGQPTTGQVRWQPRSVPANDRIHQELHMQNSGARLETSLLLDPLEGALDSIDLFVAGPFRPAWSTETKALGIQLDRLQLLEALPGLLHLGDRDAVQAISLQAGLPAGERWRLRFPTPLTKTTTLHWSTPLEKRGLPADLLTAVQAALPSCGQAAGPWGWAATLFGAQRTNEVRTWSLPLVTVLGSERTQAYVACSSATQPYRVLHHVGLMDGAAGVGVLDDPTWTRRPFKLKLASGQQFSTLVVQAWIGPDTPVRSPLVQHAWIVSSVNDSNSVLHHMGFQLWNWSRPTLPVVLPDGVTQVLGARIDGRWLDRLGPEEFVQRAPLELPITAGPQGCRVELIYATTQPLSEGPLTRILKAPAPTFPFPLPAMKHVWRLGPGLAPLHQEDLSLLNIPGHQAAAFPFTNHFRQAWRLGDSIRRAFGPIATEDLLERQQQSIRGAEASWRRQRGGREISLGEALDELILSDLSDQNPVVVDGVALEEAGVDANTMLGPLQPTSAVPCWENLGLVYVPLPTGGLLTTRQQWHHWTKQFGHRTARTALDHAVGEAVAYGQDRSGRVVSLTSWLHRSQHRALPLPMPPQIIETADEGWTLWEKVPGAEQGDSLVVLRSSRLRTTAQLFALALLVVGLRWGLALTGRWRFRVWLVGMTVCVCGFLRLPASLSDLAWWPFLAGGAMVLFWPVLAWMRPLQPGHERAASAKAPMAMVGAGALMILLLLVLRPSRSWSGGTEPFTVLLLPGAGNDQTVLVPPELLRRLEEVRQKALPETQPAVLVSGAYLGKFAGTNVELEARYEIFSFADKAELLLPLRGVELKEGLFLDGAPAFPTVNFGPGSGYRLTVHGKGWHRLTLAMLARPQRMGDYQELKVGLPVIAQSQVEMHLPATWGSLHLVEGHGEDKLQITAGKTDQVLRAQLGRTSPLHLRWLPPGNDPELPEVQEAYFWDLRPQHQSLSAGLLYTAAKGLLSQLVVEIPPQAMVRSVEATLPNQTSVLRRWHSIDKDGNRRLLIDLSQPTAGKLLVQLNLQMKPSQGNGPVPLQAPNPLGVKSSEGWLAYRLEGAKGIEQAVNLAVTNVDPATFSRVWSRLGLRDPGALERAFEFRRTGPFAALNLTVQRLQPLIEADLHARLAGPFADWSGTLRLQSPGSPVTFLEWTLPADIALTEISGPTLQQWSRHEGTVQLWFREPQSQATVEFKGYQPLVPGPNRDMRFKLPALRFPGGRLHHITWNLQPLEGASIEEQRVVGLVRQPSAKHAQALVYQASGDPYDGLFLVKSPTTAPGGQGILQATLEDEVCQIAGHFRWPQGVGKKPLRLRLDHVPGDQVRLDVADPSWTVTTVHRDGQHEWILTPPASTTGPLFVHLTGQRQAPFGQQFSFPQFQCLDANWQDCTLVLAGQPAQVGPAQGVQLWSAPKEGLFGLYIRPGSDSKVWKATGPTWTLPITPVRPALVPDVMFLDHDLQCFWQEGSSWGYLAIVDVFLYKPTDLAFRLPPGAELTAAAVDDRLVTPRIGGNQFVLPIEGLPGPRRLQLRWHFPAAVLAAAPILTGPIFPDFPLPAWQGHIMVPPGHDLAKLSAIADDGDRRLRRAAAQVRLSGLLAEDALRDHLLNSQKRFYALKRLADLDTSRGQRTPDLEASWAQLVTENQRQAKKEKFEAVRAEAEKTPWPAATKIHPAFLVPRGGRPMDWTVPEGGAVPVLTFHSTLEVGRQTSRWLAELMIVGALAFFLLSFLPWKIFSWRRSWPEWLLLIALTGIVTMGLSLVGLALAALALLGRFVWFLKRLSAWFNRPKPQTEPSSAS